MLHAVKTEPASDPFTAAPLDSGNWHVTALPPITAHGRWDDAVHPVYPPLVKASC
jgi:hypothetical protein